MHPCARVLSPTNRARLRERRRAERKWKRSVVQEHFDAFKRAKNYASLVLNQARSRYLSNFIVDNSDNQAVVQGCQISAIPAEALHCAVWL